MKIKFNGWARDHGEKIMYSDSIEEDMFEKSWPMKKGETLIEVAKSSSGKNFVKIHFSTDMRLGGEQMGVLTLSQKDLSLMLKECNFR